MNTLIRSFIVGALLAPAIGACTVVERPHDVVVREAPAQPQTPPPAQATIVTPAPVVTTTTPSVVVPATEVRTYHY